MGRPQGCEGGRGSRQLLVSPLSLFFVLFHLFYTQQSVGKWSTEGGREGEREGGRQTGHSASSS